MINEININDIKSIRNIRTEIGDISELMSTIKENGLLEPIGVSKKGNEYILIFGHRRFNALKKLGRKTLKIGKEVNIFNNITDIDLIALNIVENLHSLSNSPVEIGKSCLILKELGLNESEIAVKLSMPKARVIEAIKIIKNVPKSHIKYISYMDNGLNKKGKLSASVSSALSFAKSRYKLSDKDNKILWEEARKKELGTKDIRILCLLLTEGMKLKEALKEKDKWTNKQVDFIVRKEKLNELKKPFTDVIKEKIKKDEDLKGFFF
jgi:ParB/RepB/Spo0J family partition protein